MIHFRQVNDKTISVQINEGTVNDKAAIYYAYEKNDAVIVARVSDDKVIWGPHPYADVTVDGSPLASAKLAVEALNNFIGNFDEGGGSGGGIPDAPFDGQQYGRQSGSWTPVTGGGGGGTAADIDVDSSAFENITGGNVQDALASIDAQLGSSAGGDVVSRVDVTNLFQTNVPVPHLLIEKIDRGDGRKFIRIFGEDVSGENNNLVLTAPPDMGSLFEMSNASGADRKPKIQFGYDENGAVTAFECTITRSSPSAPNTVITFDAEIKDIDVFYMIGVGEDMPVESYYVDIFGVSHPFSIADTPIENFCTSSGAWGTILIGGAELVKSEFREIVIGTEYETTTNVPTYFLYSVFELRKLETPGLKNVTVFGSRAFSDLKQLTYLDLSEMRNLTRVGSNFCTGADRLTEINIGSLDWNTIQATSPETSFSYYNNKPTNIIYADTQALGEAFRNKFAYLSQWTIQVNTP